MQAKHNHSNAKPSLSPNTSVSLMEPLQPIWQAARDNDGRTPLHDAAACNSLEVVKYLISLGCDVNVKTPMSITPLYDAAWSNSLEVVQYLISQGADIHARDYDGDTPLYAAAS